MRKYLIFGCSTLLSLVAQNADSQPNSSVRPFSAATVKDYLSACEYHQSTCLSEVGTALMDRVNPSGPTELCLPSASYAFAVPKWLNAHPETFPMPTETGIYLALKNLYPCG